MSKYLILIIYILSPFFASAQKPLPQSRTSSYYTYIYKIDENTVKGLYAGKHPDQSSLVNPIDSFLTDKSYIRNLPAGNYLKVNAEGNKLQYSLWEERSATVKVLANGKDFQFLLIDAKGQQIVDAEVTINDRKIFYNAKARLWQSKYPRKKESLMRVYYQGVANYSEVEWEERWKPKNRLKTWILWKSPIKYAYRPLRKYYTQIKHGDFLSSHNRNDQQRKITGYLVFNKPIYKPGDTVKFKTYLVKGISHKPLKKELAVRLRDNTGKDRTLTTIKPVYKGSYNYAFPLHDSLKLKLDYNYILGLYHKKKLYRQSSFKYEDYELKSVTFEMRTENKVHHRKQGNALYFKATDENGLNILDGRVELTLNRSNVTSFFKDNTFVPDTLWKHSFKLDPIGETKVAIPDSVFPEADLLYNISADFFNSNNEKRTRTETVNFYTKPNDDLLIEAKADSLHISLKNLSGERKEARINILNDDIDTIESFKMTIPGRLKINSLATEYEVETDDAYDYLEMKGLEPEIQASARCSSDSVYIRVSNPRKIPIWYTVLKGNKIIDRGTAVDLIYNRKWSGKHNGYFRYGYVWAGESKSGRVSFQFANKELLVDVKQPVAVAPGEHRELEVSVKDAKGNPVENVDVTAYSITSKFSYNAPDIPYFGRKYKNFRERKELEISEGHSNNMLLNWQKWGREMGLDSIAYYRFTHPKPIYRYTENVGDNLTQIAPFLISKGEILPVQILYIDEKPVFFQQTKQLNRYSFKVEPGLVRLKFRLDDKIIEPEAVVISKGKKLVISFDLDSLLNKQKVSYTSRLLSDAEAGNLNNYLISITDTYSPRFATIKSPDQILLLKPDFYTTRNTPRLVGPLSYNRAKFQAKGTDEVSFEVEPNYVYTLQPGFVKQKSISQPYPFSLYLRGNTIPSYKDYVLTNIETDSLWAEFLDLQCHSINLFPRNPQLSGKLTGQLRVRMKTEKAKNNPLITSVLLYRNDNPDFLNIYPGNETVLGQLEKGDYRLMLLLKDDNYVLRENIQVRENGLTLLELNFDNICPRDSMSNAIGDKIRERAMGERKGKSPETEKIKEVFNQHFTDASQFENHMSGRVLDKKNEPLPGVSVKVKGTAIGVSTGVNGNFSIKVPEKGKLIFSYIGFEPAEIDIKPSANEVIYLDESKNLLQEVVVVGYGISNIQSLEGRLAGVDIMKSYSTGSIVNIQIRGNSSVNPGAGPLYVIDGIPVEGGLNGLSPAEIAEINMLKDVSATAIYGARGANGVVIITTKKAKEKAVMEAAEMQAIGNSLKLRNNFSDYAFWQPSLRTNSEGKIKFKVTFPDDITNWKTFFIAMNGKEQSGYAENQIKAFKPLSASFVSPQFAVKGDYFSPLGKIANYTAKSEKVTREFNYNGKTLVNAALDVKDSHIDTLAILAEGQDSLTFRYSIRKESGYSDGEERKIPLFNTGIVETKGVFSSLESDTSLQMVFDPRLGKVTFRAETSVLPVLLDETEKVHQYQYLCNEQTASKLKALLVRKKIKSYLNEPFEYDRNIKSLIKKLGESRKDNNTWGWWKNSNAELWISRHVLEALVDASEAGFEVPLNRQEMIDYLVYQLSKANGMDKLDALLMLDNLSAKVDLKAPLKLYEQEIKQRGTKASLYDDFKLLYLKQKAGEHIPIDSLLKFKHSTMFGSIYFGSNSYRFFDNSIQVSLLAYKIIRFEGRHPALLSKIRNYFLEQRKDGEWRNTYESSLILETILPDILADGKKATPPSVQLNGAINLKVDQFPYTSTFEPGAKLSIHKQGDLPVYISAHQQFWNSKPEKISNEFKVDTWFENSKGEKLSQLKGGSVVTLKAQVFVKADADYVMIEVPIPAGCSYEEKPQSWLGLEEHREYFKNKVSVFCRRLKEGVYTFDVKLMPRYDGTFTLNPAKAEMMYFPVFYGREAMKKVKIGQ